jgi:GT2 family glycosyltransferase
MPISIIVPCYNKAELTGKCLLLNLEHCIQTHQWVFIDNASDEETVEMLNRFKQEADALGHEVIIHREEENTGVARAWNRGLSYANGDYYCILNNDCVMQPGWDVAIIRAGDESNLDLYSPLVYEPGHFKQEFLLSHFLQEKLWVTYQAKNADRLAESYFSGIVLFAKSEVYKKIGLFDERLWLSMEDIDYQYRALLAGYRIGLVGSVVAYHFVSATRRTMNYSEVENQKIFAEKHGWNYQEQENTFWNKRRRTLRKLLMRKFALLSVWPEQYPIKGIK